MFNNIGRKIKTLATVLFILGCIGSGLMALGVIISYEEIEGIIIGLVAGGVGFLVSYLSVLFLYAFGDLVENTEENKRINQQILLQLQRGNAVGYGAPAAPAAPSYNPTYTAPVSYAPDAAPAAKPWFCSRCGSQNSAESSICVSCGSSKTVF